MDFAVKRARIASLAVVIVLLAGCLDGRLTSTPSGVPGWLTIYFSDPTAAGAGRLRGGPDAALASAIEQAQVSVELAVQDLNLWSLRDALLGAHERGVEVRMVVESDNLDREEIQALVAAGIPILGDRREGLMHNKFVVIDRQEVWTGSMNFTTSDVYRNDNHLARLRSEPLAENYAVEFAEMFDEDLFGTRTRAATPYPDLGINGTRLETLFSPDDGTAQRLIERIQEAQQSIHFLAFSFTQDEIADALIERAAAGVTVTGVMDAEQALSNIGSDYERFLQAGIPVRLDGNPGRMHHKVLILDERVVVLGSYNFSYSAETRNDENTLILHDPQTAALFLQEFTRIFDQAER